MTTTRTSPAPAPETASPRPSASDGARSARVLAAVLGFDGLVHLYWATGARWPATDTRSLSLALLGMQVSFSAPLLLGLAVFAFCGAGMAMLRSRPIRHRWLWVAVQAATAMFTAAVGLRALLGLWWIGTPDDLPGAFVWLNALLYTPLCLALTVIGARLIRAPRSTERPVWRRVTSLRNATLAVPVATLCLLLVGAYAYRPAADTRYSPQDALGSVTSRYLDTPLARFHYAREGTGSPVVLLSPGSAWVYAWLPELRSLAKTHTVYAVDLPGQGFTALHDRTFRFDLDGMTDAVRSFLDAAGLDGKVALAGNSWSGGWALAFAQRFPQRVSSLALLAPSGLAEPDPLTWELLKLPLVGEALTDVATANTDVVRSGLESLFVHDRLITPQLVEAMRAPNTLPDNLRATYLLERRLDWTRTQRLLPATRVRTLVLWGRQDQVLPASDAAVFAAAIPRVTVQVLDGCGHALTLDCAPRVSAQLDKFLTTHGT